MSANKLHTGNLPKRRKSSAGKFRVSVPRRRRSRRRSY